MINVHLALSLEVRTALEEGKPVVALESTIIAHGMPFPKNVETALRVEKVVRKNGAIPATCAIIDGKLVAGLGSKEIEFLGKEGLNIPKASRRDLAYLVSQGLNGATTVASTMIIAHLSGIRIFSTGGIGGVHRGATSSMDISSDLQELAQTPIAVISAGAKSILDLGLTLEYLETMGVPIIGYGTNEFPAFYTRASGYQVDFRIDTPEEIAKFLNVSQELGLRSGTLVANPVPAKNEMKADLIEETINEAILEANHQGIKGKALTPFLLAKIERLTQGSSLDTNIELVLNNAKLGAEVAVALSNKTA